MAVWAYACYPCRDTSPDEIWYVAVTDCDKLPPDAGIVRVKVKDRWRCARLDRRPVEVEGLLVRQVVPAEAADCDDCQDL